MSILCRLRLMPDAKLVPVSDLKQKAIRAADWEFCLYPEKGKSPRKMSINDETLYEWYPGTDTSKPYNFSLPSRAHNLTKIQVDYFDSDPEVFIVEMMPGYQLPDEYLGEFLDLLQRSPDIDKPGFSIGDIDIMTLYESENTILDTDRKGEIKERDLPPSICQELIELFAKVIKNPKSRLIDEKFLIPPGEVQRITTGTIDYFTRHPETWRSFRYARPQPLLLLDDRSIEDFDVYENRFALYFLRKIELKLRDLLQRYKQIDHELELQTREHQLKTNRGLEDVTEEKIISLQEQEKQAQDQFASLSYLKEKVLAFQSHPMFARVRLPDSFSFASTTLRLHPVYGRLYQLFQLIELESFSQKRLSLFTIEKSSDILTKYQTSCFLLFCNALSEMPFDLKNMKGGSEPLQTGASDDIKVNFERFDLVGKTSICLTYVCSKQSPSHLQGATILEIQNRISADETRMVRVYILPHLIWWGDKTEALERKQQYVHELYERMETIRKHAVGVNLSTPEIKQKKRSKRDDKPVVTKDENILVILAHPTPVTEFDERMDYEELRMLVNQGDNFVGDENYTRYGAYQIGCLPIYPTSRNLHRVLSRLKRLLRIQLIKAGVNHRCWNCFGEVREEENNGKIQYQCQNCRLRWGEVSCSHCGNKYMKFSFDKWENKFEISSMSSYQTDKDSIVKSEWMEGEFAAASICESIEQINKFWAICPFCGHCEKANAKSTKCRRCSSKQKNHSRLNGRY